MNQNLGVSAKTKPAANGEAKKASKPATKKANTKKKLRDFDEDDAADTEESLMKKAKTEDNSDDVNDEGEV